MPKGGSQTIQEYVVRLGASMDNAGLNQLLTALDTTKLRAMGLTAAITALATGIYKFISSITQQQFALEKLAKQQGKSIAQTRAEQEALKAMGKTLNDIQKDQALKKMYDDLVKFNKELELTNAGRAFEKIRGLQSAFYQLRAIVNHALTEIGNKVLINLEEPIKRITETFGKITDWVKNNFASFTTKISSVITAFSKGLLGIAEVFGKIWQWISSLPDGIKAIGSALGVLAVIMSTGTLGKVLAAITIIGDLIHDAENFKWNQQNAENPEFFATADGGYTKKVEEALKDESGNPVAYKIPIFLTPVWEAVFNGNGNLSETIGNAGTTLGAGIGTMINTLIDDLNKELTNEASGSNTVAGKTLESIKGIVIGIFNLIGKVITTVDFGSVAEAIGNIATWILGAITQGITDLVNSLDDAIESIDGEGSNPIIDFIVGLFTSLEKGFSSINFEKLAASIGHILSTIFGKIGSMLSGSSGSLRSLFPAVFEALKTIANGILDAALAAFNALFEVDPETKKTGIQSFVEGLFKFIGDAVHELAEYISSPDADIGGSFTEVGEKIGQLIGKAVELGASILTSLWNWIKDGQVLEDLGKIGIAICEAIGAGFVGLFDGLTDSLKGFVKDVAVYTRYISYVISGIIADIVNNPVMLTFLYMLGADTSSITNPKTNVYYNGELTTLEKLKRSGMTDADLIDVLKNDPLTTLGFNSGGGGGVEYHPENVPKNMGYYEQLNWTPDKKTTNDPTQGAKDLFDRLGIKDGNWEGISGYNLDTEVTGIPNLKTIRDVLKYVDMTGTLPTDNQGTTFSVETVLNTLKPGGNSGSAGMLENMRGMSGAIISGGIGQEYMGGARPVRPGATEDAEDGLEGVASASSDAEGNISDLGTEAKNAWPHISKLGELSGGSEIGVQLLGAAASAAAGELAKIKAPSLGGFFGGLFGSQGGRYATDTNITIGEDGTEYLIPITKPERAYALINQMLNEMGTSAISRVVNGLGLGQNGTIGASAMSIGSAMNGMSMNPVYNINAPVNINVQSTGADAREIGNAVYDMAERHLIRNMMGVYG